MSRIHPKASLVLCVLAVAAALSLAAPGGAAASEPYTFTVLLEGSLGGPLQESDGADSGLDNGGFQLGFSVVSKGDIHIGGRLGSIDFDEGLGGLSDVSLDYVNLGGEYRFHEGFYDSGVYFGLGNYEIEGRDGAGNVTTDDSIGLALGVTGEFEVTPKLGIMLELTSHITDLATEELFLTGHVGVAIHF